MIQKRLSLLFGACVLGLATTSCAVPPEECRPIELEPKSGSELLKGEIFSEKEEVEYLCDSVAIDIKWSTYHKYLAQSGTPDELFAKYYNPEVPGMGVHEMVKNEGIRVVGRKMTDEDGSASISWIKIRSNSQPEMSGKIRSGPFGGYDVDK